jgi:hypothetical protein
MEQTAFDWLHFVARSGDEGRQWAEEYRRPEVQEADQLAVRALKQMREGRLDAGAAQLEAMAERVRHGDFSPSIRAVLERWYHGVAAYLFYCREEFDRAESSLDLADAAVIAAISQQRALLPLANHCQEFRLHHARISRNRRHWEAMRRHIETAQSMIEGRASLCILKDGSAVYMSDLCAFFEALVLNDQEQEDLGPVLDEKIRFGLFDRFVAILQALPGFVIPYR